MNYFEDGEVEAAFTLKSFNVARNLVSGNKNTILGQAKSGKPPESAVAIRHRHVIILAVREVFKRSGAFFLAGSRQAMHPSCAERQQQYVGH